MPGRCHDPGSHSRRCSSKSIDPARVIVLANRAPFQHEFDPDGVPVAKRSASGLVTALEPLLETCSGTWVAHGAGPADPKVVDSSDGLVVPADCPRYRLRYVWLTPEEQRGYYSGFANEGLWPLCHDVDVQPMFRPDDFEMYQAANARFADAVVEETRPGSPLVLVQDYHFALAPRFLRQRLPSSVVTAFWHIPWPRPRVLATCPWAGRLLDGLLGSNIVGFQTDEDRVNFLRSAESTLDVNVDNRLGTISHRGRTTHLRVYPVGVEWASPVVRATPAATACRAQVCRDLNLPTDIRLGVGIDRLDYTKGLNHKLLAVERLLEVQPDLRGKFVFVQIAEPSRGSLPAYQAARRQLLETRDRVNHRLGSDAVAPILLLENHYEAADVYRFYRAADLCYVGSLDDGMNLVAKEFVSARDDERGVLILSEFAGAARQLSAALLINPYHVDRSARALAQALTMSNAEQRRRMRILRANVQACSATWWAQQLLGDAAAAVSSSSGVAAADRPFAEQALV